MAVQIGVIGVQGDVEEHVDALNAAMSEMGLEGQAFWARRPSDLESADGVVIPGGESTTISKLLTRFGLRKTIIDMANLGRPILGTCAGLVLLAKKGDGLVERTGTELLALMDMGVDRNAFGSQKDSFESPVEIPGIGRYPGVFIRAPVITQVWGSCQALSRLDGRIVLARQGNILAAAFHPELTGDSRFYKLFLSMFPRV